MPGIWEHNTTEYIAHRGELLKQASRAPKPGNTVEFMETPAAQFRSAHIFPIITDAYFRLYHVDYAQTVGITCRHVTLWAMVLTRWSNARRLLTGDSAPKSVVGRMLRAPGSPYAFELPMLTGSTAQR